MDASAPLTNFICTPDPDNPGWMHWRLRDGARFNEAVLGRQIARIEGPMTVRTRMVPDKPCHTNSAGHVHGAITLALADVSMFSALYLLRGTDAGRATTLGLTTQFISKGEAGKPLDAVVELLRETYRLAFLRGLIMQDDAVVASFEGTVRKGSSAP